MFNSPEFQALRKEYIEGALDRCAHLRDEAARLRSGSDVDLVKLRQEIHKFRGSGGFYGFAALSSSAAAAEDHLIQVLDGSFSRDDSAIAGLVEQVVTTAEAAGVEVGL